VSVRAIFSAAGGSYFQTVIDSSLKVNNRYIVLHISPVT